MWKSLTRKGNDGRDEWVTIGRITKPHALRGEVRVQPLTDVEDRFRHIERVFVRLPGSTQSVKAMHIDRVAARGSMVVVGFREVTTATEAEALRDALIQIPVTEVAPLPDGMYYHFQLLGLTVRTTEGERVGEIQEVIADNPAHDIFVVGRVSAPPALIPGVREFVKKIDIEAGIVLIEPIPGML